MANAPGADQKPESDIYTVLLMIGTVLLVAGTIFVAARTQHLFGNWVPF